MTFMKKRNFLILTALCACSLLMGQRVAEDESAVVYYMPKTLLIINADYEEIVETRGIFYQYSERYLGTTDVVTADQKRYRLNNISLHTRMEADETRAFVVPINEKSLQNCSLSITEKGTLAGVNLQAESTKHKAQSTNQKTESETLREESMLLVPFLEEQMRANSVAKMAESTAKQIYRIRENRLNLLAGDVDHLPADGVAMQQVLAELNKQEQLLTELFVGKREVRQLHHSLLYEPTQSAEQEVLFRFSSFSGITDKDDLSGEPVYLTLNAQKQDYAPAAEEKKSPLSPVYYNMPGKATVSISYQDRSFVNRTLRVAQFGVAVPLAQDIFKKSAPQIEFDYKTGMLRSIQK